MILKPKSLYSYNIYIYMVTIQFPLEDELYKKVQKEKEKHKESWRDIVLAYLKWRGVR